MIVVPFKREHIANMVIQQRQEGMEGLLTDGILKTLESGQAFTALDGDEVLACSGVIEVTEGRAIAWAYLSRDVGKRMVYVTRKVRDYLDIAPYRRIEMDVDCDFKQAHRWAKMLGFEMEAERRRAFTPDGRDCALYARVRS